MPVVQKHILAAVLVGPFWDELLIPQQRCADHFLKVNLTSTGLYLPSVAWWQQE